MRRDEAKLRANELGLRDAALMAIVLALFLGASVLTLKPFGDPDVWWHLKTGQWMAEHGSLVGDRDPFSYTTPEPIAPSKVRAMRGQWLGQAVMYLVHRIGGFGGLALLRAGLIVLPFVWMYISFVRREGRGGQGAGGARGPGGPGPGVLTASVVALPLLLPAALLTSMYERPQAFSFVLSLATVVLLDRGRDAIKNKGGLRAPAVLCLPPIMALWSNLHGGYIIGLVLIAAYALGDAADMLMDRLKGRPNRTGIWIFAWYLAAIAFASLNPGGLNLAIAYLINNSTRLLGLGASAVGGAVGAAKPQFAEFKSLGYFYGNFRYLWALYSIVFLSISGLTLLLRLFTTGDREGQRVRLDTARALAFVLISAMAYKLSRGLGFAFVVLTYYSVCFVLESGGIRRLVPPALGAISALVFLVSAVSAGLVRPAVPGSWVDDRYPKEALEFVIDEEVQGPLFNYFVWGGYIIWRAHPRYEVFVDGRSISDPIVVTSTGLLGGAPGWKEVLDAYGVNFILIPLVSEETGLVSALALNIALEAPLGPPAPPRGGWRLVFLKRNHAVFVRDVAKNRRIIEKFGLPHGLLFTDALNTLDVLLGENPSHMNLRRSKETVMRLMSRHTEPAGPD